MGCIKIHFNELRVLISLNFIFSEGDSPFWHDLPALEWVFIQVL